MIEVQTQFVTLRHPTGIRMTLIASISGIRGTIGGEPGNNLSPIDIARFTAAFGTWLTTKNNFKKIVIGRDARPSGPMLEQIVTGTLIGLGFEVINLGLSTTPTVEMAVPHFEAAGGIILTASHNPKDWNALKLLNSRGEFISKKGGLEVLDMLENNLIRFESVDYLGSVRTEKDFFQVHLDKVLALSFVDQYATAKAGLKIVVDGVNSSGGVFVPRLLHALGVKEIMCINCEPTGEFAHNPEPLKENLGEICEYVRTHKADLGIVVDPDVDRLAFVDENGELFGEEYTLVAIADWILQQKQGSVVSNLSSSRALRDLAAKYGCSYFASAVGEVNVIEKMKRHDAAIGGEGNGGVILPDLHYGRDAIVGIALFLTYLVKSGKTVSQLRRTYPDYFMSKQKIALSEEMDTDKLLEDFAKSYPKEQVDITDGVKVDFPDSWVHLRKSNTEPIVRIYSEAKSQTEADKLADSIKEKLTQLVS